MTDLIAIITRSEAFQILAGISSFAALLYEVYLRAMTRRTRHAPVLGEALEAFFRKLQSKWTTSANRMKEG